MLIPLLVLASTLVVGMLALPAARDGRERRAARQAVADERRRRAADEAAAAAREEEEREIRAIRADPARHLFQMLYIACQQRLVAMRSQLAASERTEETAREQLQLSKEQLGAYDSAHPHLRHPKVVLCATVVSLLALVLLPAALFLDWLITHARYGNVLGWVLAPFALCAIAACSHLLVAALGLGERDAAFRRTPTRWVLAGVAAALLCAITALLISWAPARSAEVYDDQIQEQAVIAQRLQQQHGDAASIEAALERKAELEEAKRQDQTSETLMILCQVGTEGVFVEALIVVGQLGWRRRLERRVTHRRRGVAAAEAGTAAVKTQLTRDATQLTLRMSEELTRAGYGIDDQRTLIGRTFAQRDDIDVLSAILGRPADVPELPPAPVAGVAPPVVAPGTAHGSAAPADVPPASTYDAPARPVREGTVPTVTEVPMPPDPPAVVDLDAVDEAS